MVSLRHLEGGGSRLYRLIFKFLQTLWDTKFDLRPDVELDVFAPRVSFSGKVTSYSHFFWQERRYGTSRNGKSEQYAFIDDRVPVRIQYIFEAIQPFWSDQIPPVNKKELEGQAADTELSHAELTPEKAPTHQPSTCEVIPDTPEVSQPATLPEVSDTVRKKLL